VTRREPRPNPVAEITYHVARLFASAAGRSETRNEEACENEEEEEEEEGGICLQGGLKGQVYGKITQLFVIVISKPANSLRRGIYGACRSTARQTHGY